MTLYCRRKSSGTSTRIVGSKDGVGGKNESDVEATELLDVWMDNDELRLLVCRRVSFLLISGPPNGVGGKLLLPTRSVDPEFRILMLLVDIGDGVPVVVDLISGGCLIGIGWLLILGASFVRV